MTTTTAKDDARFWSEILAPTGIEWSGRARYAAAMHFYTCGVMDAETLEIYRICSRMDDEDPLDVLRRWKVGAKWIALLALQQVHIAGA